MWNGPIPPYATSIHSILESNGYKVKASGKPGTMYTGPHGLWVMVNSLGFSIFLSGPPWEPLLARGQNTAEEIQQALDSVKMRLPIELKQMTHLSDEVKKFLADIHKKRPWEETRGTLNLPRASESAVAHGFKGFDHDGTAFYYEHPDGSVLGLYLNGTWSHGDSRGEHGQGDDNESLENYLASKYARIAASRNE